VRSRRDCAGDPLPPLTLLDLSDCSGVTLQGVCALAEHGTELVYVGLPWTLRNMKLPPFRAHGVNVIVQ
jgi:hypothetical protein